MPHQVHHSATIQLNAAPAKIFPLFKPKGETLWVQDWNPTYIYPDSGEVCLNSVWTTPHDRQNFAWFQAALPPLSLLFFPNNLRFPCRLKGLGKIIDIAK